MGSVKNCVKIDDMRTWLTFRMTSFAKKILGKIVITNLKCVFNANGNLRAPTVICNKFYNFRS